MDFIKRIGHIVKDGLYPKSCPMCDKILKKNQLICHKCSEKLEYIDEPKCKKCGKQLDDMRVEYCEDCRRYHHDYKMGIGVFAYNDMVSKSIYRFKYYNRRTYAECYGAAIALRCGEKIKGWQADVIIPVPIHKRKMIKRGYNQAELIARVVGEKMNIAVDERCLLRTVNTRPQKEMNKSERVQNLKKAFVVAEGAIKFKKIILIDDIYTTGSTIDACARALLEAGAKEIYFISLSIGQGI